MDKRWRNLVIIVVLIFVFILIFFLTSSGFGEDDENLVSLIENNEYTEESFSYSLGSFINPLDSSLVNDLQEFEGYENDKVFVEKVLEIEDDKNELLEDYFSLFDENTIDLCDNIHLKSDEFSDKALDIIDKINEIDSLDSSIEVDINDSRLNEQYEDLLISLSEFEYGCFSIWESIEYDLFDEEYGGFE